MQRSTLFAAVGLLALGGCQRHEPAPVASGAAAAASSAPSVASGGGLPHPAPGLYRTTVRLVSIDAPGMPPEALARMREGMAKGAEGRSACLTPEEAARGYEARVRQLANRPNCAFDHFSAQHGRLDARLTCHGGQGATAVLAMNGSITPSGSDVQMVITQSGGQVPAGGMTMTMQVKSDRIGECP